MRFWLALLFSLLAHGVLYSWLLQQQAKPVRAAAARPAPLQVSLLKRPLNNSAASVTATAAKPVSITATAAAAAPATKPQVRRQQSKAPTQIDRSQSRRNTAQASISANTAAAVTTPTATAVTTAPDFTTILEQARNQAQQRPLSSAELQAMTRNNRDHRDPTTAKTQQALNPAHLSQDVLIAFDNGSQLVKVGKDRCVITANGADLQKDIQGMKLAPCGKDKKTALFERIMADIGRNRLEKGGGAN
jgi:hypothetical protein